MPFATHRGLRIHYTSEGDGPLVVLLHGLLFDAASWKATGIVDYLQDRFRLVCIDSLGHGDSDKPLDAKLYVQPQRAGDVVAVLDELGYARAHVIGHGMGGWLAVRLAKFFPQHLSSLVIGGWNLVSGVAPDHAGPMTFERWMRRAAGEAPERVALVTPEIFPAIHACFDALSHLEGAADAVIDAKVPVMIWNGRDDPHHDPMRVFARQHGLRSLSTPGDHHGMLAHLVPRGAASLAEFWDAAERVRPTIEPSPQRAGETLSRG
uniref:Alpha/beta hydrolase fold n=1 Tax=Rhodopseudomonas palustris (strain BisA53) TaxID=316055 RepID=Q07MB5_RHOP5